MREFFFRRGEKEINKTRNGCARFYFIPLKGWLRDQMSVDGVMLAGGDGSNLQETERGI